MPISTNPRVLYTALSAAVIITGSFIAIRFAEGYRFTLSRQQQAVHATGLLSANSFPSGAYISVDGKRIGVTDNTFYFEPKTYTVEITKDGYLPWQKDVLIEPELVAQTNAQLYKIVPSLTPLTYTGIRNIAPAPNGEKIIYYTASASAKNRNGLYILELTTTLLNAQREPRQIAEETTGFDLENATYIWSPDNSQVLLSTADRDVILDVNKVNTLSTLADVGFRKLDLLSEWEAEMYIRERQYLSKFPIQVQEIASQSAMNVYMSPDKKKLLYTATESVSLPPNLIPTVLATNSQPEERELQPGSTYVYDQEEDKNFKLDVIPLQLDYQEVATSSAAQKYSKVLLANDLFGPAKSFTATPSSFKRLHASGSAQMAENFSKYYSSLYTHGIQWFPDSRHILFSDGQRIFLVEYDNTNRTAVYSGPFDPKFIYPWPDGSRILTLTSLGSISLPNLYGIDIK